MRRKREQIDAFACDVDADMSGRLHRVGVEGDAVRAADCAQLGDRLNGADFVVGVHNRRQRGVVAQLGGQLGGADVSVLVHGQVGDGKAFLFQRFERMQHRVVLKRGGDDAALPLFRARLRQSADGPVVRLAAAGGEVQLVRCAAEPGGHTGAAVAQQLLRGLPFAVQ